jgi:hypothetical protein
MLGREERTVEADHDTFVDIYGFISVTVLVLDTD